MKFSLPLIRHNFAGFNVLSSLHEHPKEYMECRN